MLGERVALQPEMAEARGGQQGGEVRKAVTIGDEGLERRERTDGVWKTGEMVVRNVKHLQGGHVSNRAGERGEAVALEGHGLQRGGKVGRVSGCRP